MFHFEPIEMSVWAQSVCGVCASQTFTNVCSQTESLLKELTYRTKEVYICNLFTDPKYQLQATFKMLTFIEIFCRLFLEFNRRQHCYACQFSACIRVSA